MADIGDERRELLKDIVQELNAEEPSREQDLPTDVDEQAVLARAEQQLGGQVTEPRSYDSSQYVQASREATEKPVSSPTVDQQPASGPTVDQQQVSSPIADQQTASSTPADQPQGAPDVEDNETIARAKRQLGL